MVGKAINIRSRDGGEFDCYLVTPEPESKRSPLRPLPEVYLLRSASPFTAHCNFGPPCPGVHPPTKAERSYGANQYIITLLRVSPLLSRSHEL